MPSGPNKNTYSRSNHGLKRSYISRKGPVPLFKCLHCDLNAPERFPDLNVQFEECFGGGDLLNNCSHERFADLEARCESFGNDLDSRANLDAEPLDAEFVRIFNEFVAEYPSVLLWEDDKSGQPLLGKLYLYLSFAVRREDPLDSFRELISQTPQVLEVEDECGELLLHKACGTNAATPAFDVVSFFLHHYPDVAKVSERATQCTPLDYACWSRQPSLAVIRELYEAYPPAAYVVNHFGDTPLHDACYFGSPFDVVEFLVSRTPACCLIPNYVNGKSALDEAKDGSERDDVVDLLTLSSKAAGRALLERLRFCGPPREIFERVAAYLDDGPLKEVGMVELTFFDVEIVVMFRREDVLTEFRDRIAK